MTVCVARLPARANSGCLKSANHSITSCGSVSVKSRPTWPFICCQGTEIRIHIKEPETSGEPAFARLCNPDRCSSSGVVPSAFAITALRPKNIRAELFLNVGIE
jgi:hypothetical protein